MPTVHVSVSLPQGVLNLIERQGLLEPDALAALLCGAVSDDAHAKKQVRSTWPEDVPLPEGVWPELADLIDPDTYGCAKELGDILAPVDVEWEAMK